MPTDKGAPSPEYEETKREWTDPDVAAAEAQALMDEGWQLVDREALPGLYRVTWRRLKP